MLLICILFRTQLCNITLPCNIWFLFSSTQPVCSAYFPATRQHASESHLSGQGCGKYMGGGTHPLHIFSCRYVYTHSYPPPLPLSPPPPCHTYAKIVQTMYTFLMLLLSHRYYTRSSVMLSKSQLILFGKDNSTQVKIFASI
jgi:hypothetical protein